MNPDSLVLDYTLNYYALVCLRIVCASSGCGIKREAFSTGKCFISIVCVLTS